MSANGYGKKIREITEGFAMVLLLYAITWLIAFFVKNWPGPGRKLAAQDLIFPLLFATEFLVIVPLYFYFFCQRAGFGKGEFKLTHFFLALSAIMAVQLAGIYTYPPEMRWRKISVPYNTVFFLNYFMITLIAPVYEEMVFRGCLFNSVKCLFKGNIYATAVVVSLFFVSLHTQHWRNGIALCVLFFVSLILVAARVISQGILLPVCLHITMNAGTIIKFI